MDANQTKKQGETQRWGMNTYCKCGGGVAEGHEGVDTDGELSKAAGEFWCEECGGDIDSYDIDAIMAPWPKPVRR